MNLWFPFCAKDYGRSIEWMEWVGELRFQRHHIVLHPAQEVKDYSRLHELAKKAFETVTVEPDREGLTGWPEGPNCAFRQAAWFFYNKSPWMFMENDAWPLVADCFDRLEAEYKACGKPFIGDQAPAGKGYSTHMSGVAIYPANMPDYSPKTVMAQSMAFDVYDPDPIVANMHKTPLIQHCFFHPENEIPTFKTLESLSLLRSDAVIFHRNKDCTLPRRLRERMRGATVSENPHTPDKQIVYTYYDKVEGMPSQEWMLQKWAASWEAAGFTPKVLSRKEAETHSNFKELETLFSSYPTINPPGYELACWLRWIAMVQVGGGTLMDFDVLPYGMDGRRFGITTVKNEEWDLPVVFMTSNPCPCVVVGTAKEFNNAVTWFANNRELCTKEERGKPHASDQTGVQSGHPWVALDICYQYGREGWEKASMVHYSHSSCGGRPREQVIPEAEKLRDKTPHVTENLNRLPSSEELFSKEGKKGVFSGPLIELTWIDKIRDRVAYLLSESKVSDNNRTRIMQELNKAGLVPGGVKYAPKKRRNKRKLTKV